jgi:hypothetical protein
LRWYEKIFAGFSLFSLLLMSCALYSGAQNLDHGLR